MKTALYPNQPWHLQLRRALYNAVPGIVRTVQVAVMACCVGWLLLEVAHQAGLQQEAPAAMGMLRFVVWVGGFAMVALTAAHAPIHSRGLPDLVDEGVCRHEATHAVVARNLGLPVRRLDAVEGSCTVQVAATVQQMMASCAFAIAPRHLHGPGSSTDGEWSPQDMLVLDQAVTWLELNTGRPRAELIREADALANRVVDAHRDDIDRVAVALARSLRGQLDEYQCRKVLRDVTVQPPVRH